MKVTKHVNEMSILDLRVVTKLATFFNIFYTRGSHGYNL